MTNYCSNRFAIEGTPEEVRAFAQDCLSERGELHLLDFEKIQPMPAILKGLHRSISSKLGGRFADALSSGRVGMEALSRKPSPRPDREFGADQVPAASVLDRETVRKNGIQSYDDLERWLAKHEPASLDLGQKCLAAFQACGHCFEEDWIERQWDVLPDRIEYHHAELTDATYDAAFVSPWGAPEQIIREIARRHPGLTIRFEALEEGNEYTFVLTSKDGIVSEDRPPITDEFIDELEGPGETQSRLESERTFYETPSTLRRQPRRKIRYWLRERRLKRALANYPAYSPPHHGVEWMMAEQQARENFEFFLARRHSRIDALREFMGQFNIVIGYDHHTKTALDQWLASYGALLFVSETGNSFLTHQPEWTGPRLGLNVIFDLAVLIGEYAVRETPWLAWKMDTNTDIGRTRTDQWFQRPVLASTRDDAPFSRDVICETHDICRSLSQTSYAGKNRLRIREIELRERHFATKTLRLAFLHARGEFEAANNEWRALP